jgi:DNA-binding protein YbaB
MFDKVKQAADAMSMMNKAKKFQKELEKIEHSEEKNGVHVKVNGGQQIVYMSIDGEDRRDIVELVNKAMQEVQKKVAMEHKDELMSMLMGK